MSRRLGKMLNEDPYDRGRDQNVGLDTSLVSRVQHLCCDGWVSQPTSRYPPFILVGFSVYTCVFGRAYLPGLAPGCAYLLVALCRLRQPFTPVHSSRALELRMSKLHCFRVEFRG